MKMPKLYPCPYKKNVQCFMGNPCGKCSTFSVYQAEIAQYGLSHISSRMKDDIIKFVASNSFGGFQYSDGKGIWTHKRQDKHARSFVDSVIEQLLKEEEMGRQDEQTV